MKLRIEGIEIGEGLEPKVIAEIGINHGGDVDVAIQMADVAIDNGAHLIKHQTHIPDKEMSREAETAIPGNSPLSIFEIMQNCHLSEDHEFQLMQHVRSRKGVFISTPFSREAADRLESWGVAAYKIGSGECNNYPFVQYVAKKGKPILLSTGMNSIESISRSVEILRSYDVPFALLHTTNLYPTPHHLLRLGALNDMKQAFPGVPLGLSDHSTSNAACLASIPLGATVLERHFTDSKLREGPDIICSMDGSDLRELLAMSREVFLALGGRKEATDQESVTANFAFASVATTREINAGEVFTEENIFPIRPSGGDFGPKDYETLLGKRASGSIDARVQLRRKDVDAL
jgi:N-acetylneuraminate synthase